MAWRRRTEFQTRCHRFPSVSGQCHHPRDRFAAGSYGAGGFGVLGMARLVVLHRAQDGAKKKYVGPRAGFAGVLAGAPRPGARSRPRSLGSSHRRATRPARRSHSFAGVPQRVERAGAAVQLAQAIRAPGGWSVSSCAAASNCSRVARVAGDRRPTDVERLRADLADMVDPHQAGGVAALGLVRTTSGWLRRGWRALSRGLPTTVDRAFCAESSRRSSGLRMRDVDMRPFWWAAGVSCTNPLPGLSSRSFRAENPFGPLPEKEQREATFPSAKGHDGFETSRPCTP